MIFKILVQTKCRGNLKVPGEYTVINNKYTGIKLKQIFLNKLILFYTDPDEIGYNIFDDLPFEINDEKKKINLSTMEGANLGSTDIVVKSETCDTNSNIMVVDPNNIKPKHNEKIAESKLENISKKNKKLSKNCTVVLNSIDSSYENSKPQGSKLEYIKKPSNNENSQFDQIDGDDSDCKLFEFEESENPLIPLYHLRDEGSIKWVLLSDLCYLLKVKSKDTLLKQVSKIHVTFKLFKICNTFLTITYYF